MGSQPIIYSRIIKAVSGDTITIDAPAFNHLDRSLAQSYVYKWDPSGQTWRIGVENLRVDIQYSGDPNQDENHAKTAIQLYGTEDSRVRDVSTRHFAYAAVEVVESFRCTVENVMARDPVSMVTGGRRYTFGAGDRAHSVAWNCDASGKPITIPKQPTAHDYAVGCFGTVNGSGPFPGPPTGFIEGTNTAGLTPSSLYALYEAQLADRT